MLKTTFDAIESDPALQKKIEDEVLARIKEKETESPIKWSILILTQPSRETFLKRLLHVLEPQVEGRYDVEIVTRLFDKGMDIGANRQRMIEEARGEYISFVDDDDLVPPNHVATIYPLLDGVDYIGFRLQLFLDDRKQKPTFHSLRYDGWNADSEGWYRDLSYMNPIRRKLALAVKIEGPAGEDSRWAERLRELKIVKTEHFIDEVMYFYYFRSQKPELTAPVQTQSDPRPTAIRHTCTECGNTSNGMAGGMRQCNQCGHRWI
jgi:hypothetical protein